MFWVVVWIILNKLTGSTETLAAALRVAAYKIGGGFRGLVTDAVYLSIFHEEAPRASNQLWTALASSNPPRVPDSTRPTRVPGQGVGVLVPYSVPQW